ncbi:hypothetical protein [Candidatus Karelsulcia muelleri]|uniref:Uncharacterized protein n=1 Tax=Candidatus Karelsulcia muelleri PSPU TaxID=1189303 RepID=A0AAD1B011_9FLAO|nr:hypothetical protein [Candidatus Karelsulcia muelleri]NJJ98833.1 hypothetical protein [Candidatus Karelsulcia muelleri]BAO66257.1 hypothetical protein SMPSPU_087 [Candidatus Karelsulcia muelleri PSPU]
MNFLFRKIKMNFFLIKIKILLFVGLTFFIYDLYNQLYINDYNIIQLIDCYKLKDNKNYIYNNNKNYYIKQIYNRPWAALYTSTIYFFNMSLGVFVFLTIQYISKSKWSIILINIMEGIIKFLPFGSILILLILILNNIGIINMFDKMNDYIFHIKYSNKHNLFLNKPYINYIFFYFLRSYIYIYILNFFLKKILNKYKKKKNNKIYYYSVLFIIFNSIYTIYIGWDWIMFLNPNFISTIFNWSLLGSNLVIGISIITLFSFFLFRKKIFSFFKRKHLYDLSKYIFTTSLLWSYLCFSQFLLIWYSNIPEEGFYFTNQANKYKYLEKIIIIINFIIPFLSLIKKKNKMNKKKLILICINLIIGHYLNLYNFIMSESVGIFSGYEEISSFLFVGSLFFLNTIKDFNNYLK